MAFQGNYVTFVKKQTVARNLKLKKNYLFFGLVGLSMTRFYHSCILVDSYNETDIFTIGSFHLALLEYN